MPNISQEALLPQKTNTSVNNTPLDLTLDLSGYKSRGFIEGFIKSNATPVAVKVQGSRNNSDWRLIEDFILSNAATPTSYVWPGNSTPLEALRNAWPYVRVFTNTTPASTPYTLEAEIVATLK